ncbi:MAG: methylated-DNA--[protein]-cysteine S-methyltransferase [Alphaproteobacteria bacterium]
MDETRIAEIIEWLARNFRAQPSLAEMAARAGVSPHHFQREFARRVGVSPKKFVQHLSLRHAKARLRASASVLDAAFDAGFSGPGRLHDLFVEHEAVTPGDYKRRGAGLVIRYGSLASPFGSCRLFATERGLCGLAFADDRDGRGVLDGMRRRWPAARFVADPALGTAYEGQLFAGPAPLPPASLRLYIAGTPFQLQVWRALLRIPPGALVTYGDLARRLGRPGAARAVGGAVGRNPLAWLIPCHRVVREQGGLGGYAWGLDRKRAMLAWEGARGEDVAVSDGRTA